MIDASPWDLPALRAGWRGATPFPHLVFDGVLDEEELAAVRQGVAAEPHWPDFGELHHFAGSAPSLQQPTLQRLEAALGAPELLAAVAAVTGHLVRRVEARSYVYVPGSYLLPHTDCNPERAVSFALYLSPREGCEGGELELFGATTEEGEIVATAPAVTIEPLPGRLVLLDVSPLSLHQVREVLAGHRASIAGWLLR